MMMMIEGRVLKKCGMKVDMLSSLPDELLVHILSFLPIHTSASTSILSRRWLHLWKYTTKLIFRNENPAKSVNWVNPALKSHRSPSLQEFTIDVRVIYWNRRDVAKWLDFAFSRRVENLGLDFQGWRHSFRYYGPRLEKIIKLLQVPTTSIRSLKVLRLLELKTNGDSIQFFLKNCPFLEELVIHEAAITSDLELIGPSLRFLELEPKFRNKNFSIKVSAPNLTKLTVGINDSSRVFLEDVPKLVDMVFRCSNDSTMQGFATATSQLETLAFSMMNDPLALLSVPEMPKLKKLVVDDRFHIPYNGTVVPFPVTSFLRASPCLEEIEIQITELVLEEGVGSVFQHASLKRFKLWWSCGGGSLRDDYIKLVRYVLDNCFALEEIEISRCDEYGTKWRSWFYVVVDYGSVREATMEERVSFENTIQRKIPGHIKLRVANHFHKSQS